MSEHEKDIGIGLAGAGLGALLLRINHDPGSRLKVRGMFDPGRDRVHQRYDEARRGYEELSKANPPESSPEGGRLRRCRKLIERYEARAEQPSFDMELHVIRLGEIALATNPFELFLDYGLQIKARSRALQTFLVQLSAGRGGYLPTARAVAAGGYGATARENRVGPEGGKLLVERTVGLINSLWDAGAR